MEKSNVTTLKPKNKSDEKIVKQFTEVWRSNSTAAECCQLYQ